MEIKLQFRHQISLPSEKRRNASALYNPSTIKEIQKKYNYVEWLDYINALLPPNLQVKEDEQVIISVPTFFADLENILKTTPKR